MTEFKATTVPAALRAAIAADLAPVHPLARPLARTLWMTPLALLLLFAAPVAFEFRRFDSLGWVWFWGASAVQLAAGLALVAAALREAVPGRAWSRSALVALAIAPLALLVTITLGSWSRSPVVLARQWWIVGAICLFASATTALPAVALGCVMVRRAFPTRPAIAGALAGLGAGLMADAGWRLFCHFSEPGHVLGHAGGVLLATVIGSAITVLGTRPDRSSRSRSYP